MTRMYMHLADGKPAAFDGEQITHSWEKTPVVKDLRTIKEQQRKSVVFRKKHKYTLIGYSYIIIEVPE